MNILEKFYKRKEPRYKKLIRKYYNIYVLKCIWIASGVYWLRRKVMKYGNMKIGKYEINYYHSLDEYVEIVNLKDGLSVSVGFEDGNIDGYYYDRG